MSEKGAMIAVGSEPEFAISAPPGYAAVKDRTVMLPERPATFQRARQFEESQRIDHDQPSVDTCLVGPALDAIGSHSVQPGPRFKDEISCSFSLMISGTATWAAMARPKSRRPAWTVWRARGARFTDAHAVAAVCNPSRYSILSGTYLWHAKRKNDYSLYFHDGQVTLPVLLKLAGYRTAALGKWHNGFGREPEPDWNGELKPGPLEVGFDYFFGTPRTHNEPPLVFVENHGVIGLDPADPIRIDKTKGPHGVMIGGRKAQAARPDDQIDSILAEKAAAFFAQQSKDTPFFLYLAFAAPHVPIDPAPKFRGKSRVGLYGDYVQQLDHCTGLVLDALDEHGFSQNTLVIFTSDNGAMFTRDAVKVAHRCNGVLLGQKTDAWEGGHRVPLIARWPGHIPSGSVRKPLFSQVDIMATLADAAGVPLPSGASPDGTSDLAAFIRPGQCTGKTDRGAVPRHRWVRTATG